MIVGALTIPSRRSDALMKPSKHCGYPIGNMEFLRPYHLVWLDRKRMFNLHIIAHPHLRMASHPYPHIE
jgi:hypothetical protein